MIHDGIQHGVMEAFAEGFNTLSRAGTGHGVAEAAQAGYDLDVAAIAETWRHGSALQSFLLDLAAAAFTDEKSRWGERLASLEANRSALEAASV
jgi:6-phosphogluconate dehydrogenase